MRTAEERRLWSRWREQRDEAAFERLVEPHLPFAIDLARRLGCDEHDADDIAQQSLVALATASDDRPTEVGVRAWVGRRVSLGVKSLRRARRRRRAREDQASSPPVVTRPVDLDNRDAVDAALAQLDPDERQVVVLRFLHDLEYREVAYVLGISPVAARLRVHRALHKLRARLGRNASAMIAAGALWTGSKPARALVEGAWLVSKSVKITLLAALALVVALFSFRAYGPRADAEVRAPAKHARETARSPAPDAESAPGELEAPHLQDVKDAEAAMASLRRGKWSSYESRRAAAGMMQRSRKLLERIEALAPGETDPEPKADSTARLYLEELIGKYERMSAGQPRLDVLTTAAAAHRRYVEATHDLAFLGFFNRVLASGSERERVHVVASLTGLGFDAVVDLLLRAAKHADAPVRATAVGSLADLRDETGRAHRAVRSALRDPEAEVRWNAAVGLEFSCGTARDVPALLDGIGREEDPVAMHAMIQAVRALDSTDGEQRVRDVLAGAPGAVRATGDEALAHRSDPQPFRVKSADPGAAHAAPAEEAASTRAYLERLGEEILTLPAGEQRERKYRAFSSSHADYVRTAQSTDLLPLLRRLVDHASASEQRSLLSSLGRFPLPPFVDQLIAWSKDSESAVRSAAGQGLVWVQGSEKARARKAALALLDDPVARVRLQVGMALRVANEPDVVTALISRLSLETDYSVAYGILITATSMDKTARERIENAVASMPAEQADLIRRALAER